MDENASGSAEKHVEPCFQRCSLVLPWKKEKKRSHQPRTRFSLYQLHCDDNDIPRRNTRHIPFRRRRISFHRVCFSTAIEKKRECSSASSGNRANSASVQPFSFQEFFLNWCYRLYEMSMDFRAFWENFSKRESELNSWNLFEIVWTLEWNLLTTNVVVNQFYYRSSRNENWTRLVFGRAERKLWIFRY